PEAQIGASLLQIALRRLRRDKLTVTAIAVFCILTLLSILAPEITTMLKVDATTTDGAQHMLPIGAPGHILGTDDIGRDQLARLLYAGQVSLGIAFIGGGLSISIGLVLGVITGFYGGVIGAFVNWVIARL